MAETSSRKSGRRHDIDSETQELVQFLGETGYPQQFVTGTWSQVDEKI